MDATLAKIKFQKSSLAKNMIASSEPKAEPFDEEPPQIAAAVKRPIGKSRRFNAYGDGNTDTERESNSTSLELAVASAAQLTAPPKLPVGRSSKFGSFSLPNSSTWETIFTVLRADKLAKHADVDATTQRTIFLNYELNCNVNGEVQIMGRAQRRSRIGQPYLLPVCREENFKQVVVDCHTELGHANTMETQAELLTQWHEMPLTKVDFVVRQCTDYACHKSLSADDSIAPTIKKQKNAPISAPVLAPASVKRARLNAEPPSLLRETAPSLSPQSTSTNSTLGQPRPPIVVGGGAPLNVLPTMPIRITTGSPPTLMLGNSNNHSSNNNNSHIFLTERKLRLECDRLEQLMKHEAKTQAMELVVLKLKEEKLKLEVRQLKEREVGAEEFD